MAILLDICHILCLTIFLIMVCLTSLFLFLTSSVICGKMTQGTPIFVFYGIYCSVSTVLERNYPLILVLWRQGCSTHSICTKYLIKAVGPDLLPHFGECSHKQLGQGSLRVKRINLPTMK